MDDIQLDYAPPSAACSRYVSLFYRFRANAARFEDTERADHAQFRFRLTSGRAEYRFAGGAVMEAPAVHLVGSTTGATRVSAEGPIDVFGCGLTPEGWAAMLGPTASGLRNRLADAVDLLGEPVRLAVGQLADARDFDAMVAIAERLILQLVRQSSAQLADFVGKVDRWLSDAASPIIGDLIDATGLSRRQLERKCLALYGAPPKLLARKYRALRTAAAIVSGRLTAADVIDRGYYDQSHMIREVKHFIGYTPGQIAAAPNALARLTIEKHNGFVGHVG